MKAVPLPRRKASDAIDALSRSLQLSLGELVAKKSERNDEDTGTGIVNVFCPIFPELLLKRRELKFIAGRVSRITAPRETGREDRDSYRGDPRNQTRQVVSIPLGDSV